MRIDIFRSGSFHSSDNYAPLFSYEGTRIGEIALTDSDTIRWDLRKISIHNNNYRDMSISEMMDIFRKAGQSFATQKISMGDTQLDPEQYAALYSQLTGAVISAPLSAIKKVQSYFEAMPELLKSQAINHDINAYKVGYTHRDQKFIGWIPRGDNLFVMPPSNHPSVNILWSIACAMGLNIILRPSLNDPITPLRLMKCLLDAGLPSSTFSYYPTTHSPIKDFIDLTDLSILFGGEVLVNTYANSADTKVFGPGRSAIIIDNGNGCIDDQYIDLICDSMMQDGGRGCINLSTVIVRQDGMETAERIAEKLSHIKPLPPIDNKSRISAFPKKKIAETIHHHIEQYISTGLDVSAKYRDTPRFIEAFGTTFLMPTVLFYTADNNGQHNLLGSEFPFPFITVTEMLDEDRIASHLADSLVVTLLSDNDALANKLIFNPDIGKVYIGRFKTCDMDYLEPHEGYISEFLFKTKAIRKERCHAP